MKAFTTVILAFLVGGCVASDPLPKAAVDAEDWHHCPVCGGERHDIAVERSFNQAAEDGDLAVMGQIVAKHRHVLFTGYMPGTFWPIHSAARNGDLAMVKWLVGENPDYLNREENWIGTPLDFARYYKHHLLAWWLRVKGAKTRKEMHNKPHAPDLVNSAR